MPGDEFGCQEGLKFVFMWHRFYNSLLTHSSNLKEAIRISLFNRYAAIFIFFFSGALYIWVKHYSCAISKFSGNGDTSKLKLFSSFPLNCNIYFQYLLFEQIKYGSDHIQNSAITPFKRQLNWILNLGNITCFSKRQLMA